MERARVALQVQAVGFPRLRLPVHQHVPVVHVQALDHASIQEQEELGVFGVVPFLDLGAQVQPQGLARKAVRHGKFRAEPIVGVRAVPMVPAAVKGQEGAIGLIRVPGGDEVSDFIFPLIDQTLLADRFLF